MTLEESHHSILLNWEANIILLISIFSLLKAIDIYVGMQVAAILQGTSFHFVYISFSFLIFPFFDLILNPFFWEGAIFLMHKKVHFQLKKYSMVIRDSYWKICRY